MIELEIFKKAAAKPTQQNIQAAFAAASEGLYVRCSLFDKEDAHSDRTASTEAHNSRGNPFTCTITLGKAVDVARGQKLTPAGTLVAQAVIAQWVRKLENEHS